MPLNDFRCHGYKDRNVPQLSLRDLFFDGQINYEWIIQFIMF